MCPYIGFWHVLRRLISVIAVLDIVVVMSGLLDTHALAGQPPMGCLEGTASSTSSNICFGSTRVGKVRRYCAAASRSDLDLGEVENSVRAGDRRAAKYLISHLSRLDGGNLEDALTSLGQFSDKRMIDFLLFSKKRLLSDNDFISALTMTPLSISDDACDQVLLLRCRKYKASIINKSNIIEQKRHAIDAISGFISEINSHLTTDSRC